MLIILPSSPTTEAASDYLSSQGIAHIVIPVPESLSYKTGSDTAIYIDTQEDPHAHADIPMQLTKHRFVVMRVFKDYVQ